MLVGAVGRLRARMTGYLYIMEEGAKAALGLPPLPESACVETALVSNKSSA